MNIMSEMAPKPNEADDLIDSLLEFHRRRGQMCHATSPGPAVTPEQYAIGYLRAMLNRMAATDTTIRRQLAARAKSAKSRL